MQPVFVCLQHVFETSKQELAAFLLSAVPTGQQQLNFPLVGIDKLFLNRGEVHRTDDVCGQSTTNPSTKFYQEQGKSVRSRMNLYRPNSRFRQLKITLRRRSVVRRPVRSAMKQSRSSKPSSIYSEASEAQFDHHEAPQQPILRPSKKRNSPAENEHTRRKSFT